jgi:hypothetical protein
MKWLLYFVIASRCWSRSFLEPAFSFLPGPGFALDHFERKT